MEAIKQILANQNATGDQSNDSTSIRRARVSVPIALMILGLAFFVWALVAELDTVIVAPGDVVETRDLEKVQHLEGGILDQLLVEEGQQVFRGQAIATLRGADSVSSLLSLEAETNALLGQIARLEALINDTAPDFSEIQDESVVRFSQRFFDIESERNRSMDATLELQISKDQQLLSSMLNRLASSIEQGELMERKVDIRSELYERQVSSLIELIQAEIDDLNMRREIENLREAILDKELTIYATQQELRTQRIDRMANYIAELDSARNKYMTNLASLPAARDKVERLTIYSPSDGVIDNIHFNYESAVVPPGESFADIAPLDRHLLAEVRVNPNDIGHVEVGQAVRLKINTYDFAQYGWIDGTVVAISRYATETDQEKYFIARIELERDFVMKEGIEYKVSPAMELSAEIITGRRTVADYFIKPIKYLISGVFDER